MKILMLSALFLVSSVHAASVTGKVKSYLRHVPEFGEDVVDYQIVTTEGKKIHLPKWINGAVLPVANTITIEGEVERFSVSNIKSVKITVGEESRDMEKYEGYISTNGSDLVVVTFNEDIAFPKMLEAKRLFDLKATVAIKAKLGWGNECYEGNRFCGTRPILKLSTVEVKF